MSLAPRMPRVPFYANLRTSDFGIYREHACDYDVAVGRHRAKPGKILEGRDTERTPEPCNFFCIMFWAEAINQITLWVGMTTCNLSNICRGSD